MKALVKTARGKGNVQVMDVPTPQLKNPGDVLIEVRSAGVCGTDIHIWHEEFISYPPVILGHEFSGVVVEVGEGVTCFQPGDAVIAEPHSLACGTCHVCRTGYSQLCKSKRSPGWGKDGAFTDYVVMEDYLLHKIPQGVPFDVAALAEPFAIVVHEALERGVVEPNDTVVVVGAGPIGLLAAFAAKQVGAGQVIVAGTNADEAQRFPAAGRMGADHIINVQKENVVDRVLELTGGRGADLVVEASGSPGGIQSAARMVRIRGRISAIGLPVTDLVEVPWKELMMKVVDVKCNFSSSFTAWDKALFFMKKDAQALSSLITHRAGIDDWERIFTEMERGNGIKAMFIPDKFR